MRYFKLINNTGDELDITSQKIFFHEIGGLGFEEETSYRRIGETWWLNSATFRQTPITGKISFTGYDGADPYELYFDFSKFIARTPLVLVYHPYGEDLIGYRKNVRVTKLEKSEITKYGIIEEDVVFTPYTPWYEVQKADNKRGSKDSESGWIWGGDTYPPLKFEPSSTAYTKAKFRGETKQTITLHSPVGTSGPIKITIYGPVNNPSWFHYVGNSLIESGSFSQNISIASNEHLVIDNTEGHFSMEVYNESTGDVRNVYSLRDFNEVCFFNLKEGANTIQVTSPDNIPITVTLEGHIYYATV